jgi:hypothetical protein
MVKKNRYVYGTRSNRWHSVNKSDRDYPHGFTSAELKRIGKAEAKKRYLAGILIK